MQRYRINNITAKSLTKFDQPSKTQVRVLAGAFADPKTTYSMTVGEQDFSFKGLLFAGQEVTNLASVFPGTAKYLDHDFSLLNVKPLMNGFSLVHLATHAAFIPGDPTLSFILFGDGKIATLQDIENWSLSNVDLVVLSACETGVGIRDFGEKVLGQGEEILGLGYQFQNRGARAAIASLWSVDDGGTQTLMNAFYEQLQQGKTKAEALQQAQIALINANRKPNGNQRQTSIAIEAINNGVPVTVVDRLSHPYYWAPFILIGNGF